MALNRFQQQGSYNLGNLGTNYGAKLEFVWPQTGLYTCSFTVTPGDQFNLQGVDPGTYSWSFGNYQPEDPTLLQTVQTIVGTSMPPLVFGRRAIAKTGVVGSFAPWQRILQWNGPGNPLTG